MIFLRATDGDTSYQSCESFSFPSQNHSTKFGAQQELRRSTSTASDSSEAVRDETRQKWKSLGLSDSDGSEADVVGGGCEEEEEEEERLRDSGGKIPADKGKGVGGGVNFYCDMISPSPSSRGRIQLRNFGLSFGLKNSLRFYFDMSKLFMDPNVLSVILA